MPDLPIQVPDRQTTGFRPAGLPAKEGGSAPRQWLRFAMAAVVLLAIYAWPLTQLARVALSGDLYSHVLLIPVISGYLIWERRSMLPSVDSIGRAWAVVPAGLGVIALLIVASLRARGAILTIEDHLSGLIFSWWCFLTAIGIGLLGGAWVRSVTFPVAFLLFMVPFPDVVKDGIDLFFQHTSAAAAEMLMRIARVPMLRDGLHFQLPGIQIQVAAECSGIRSTLVLFIISLLGGYMLLRRAGHRWALALFVIPLAAARNGLRIATLAWLCANVGTEMIHSWIHHRGGPVFFALSLIPFFGLLLLLRWREARQREVPGGSNG